MTYIMAKQKEIKLDELTAEEKIKYEIAAELGLLNQVLSDGWKTLSAKDTGRIGGLMTKRKKALNKI
jgi:Small, acid-soluble spore proteins, alpha/beta type.